MACVWGIGLLDYVYLFGLEAFICQIIGGSTVFLARILAVKYSICLPILKGEQR